jgi:palmitoyltransferase
LIAKPIKTSVEIYPYDLPREITERKIILERNKGWVDLLKLKDEAIWTLTQEKKQLRGKLVEALNE